MGDQTQRVGEAQVLDENWPSQLAGFSEAVTLCQLRTLQDPLVWTESLCQAFYPFFGWLVEGWQWKVSITCLASSPIIKRQIGVTLLGKLVHYFGEFIIKLFCVKNDTNHLMKEGNYPFNFVCGGRPWVFRGQISLCVFLSALMACFPE